MVKTLKANLPILSFLLILVPILNFFILHKSFNFGLYGDDWLQLYNLWLSFDVHKTLSYFDIKSYLGAYWPQYLFLGIIRHFGGYDPLAYFFASYFLKVLASITLYFTVKELSKSSLASMLSVILFVISSAGLETTDWVFNMNTFAGIFFFNLALFFYLSLRASKKYISKKYFLFITFFALSLFIVPVRMHGAIPLLIISDIFLTLFIEKKWFSKHFLLRTLTAFIILMLFVNAGSYGTPEYSRERIGGGVSLMQQLVAHKQYDFIFYFFGIVGHMFFPDSVKMDPLLKSLPINSVLLISLIILILEISISKIIFNSRRSITLIAILNLIGVLVGLFIQKVNPSIPHQNLFSILIGYHLYAIGIWLFLLKSKVIENLTRTIIISLFWITLFTIVYWLYAPYFLIETTGRYLTFGAVGVSIFLGTLIAYLITNLQKNPKSNKLLFLIPLILLILYTLSHLYAGQLYLGNLEKSRNQFITQKSWDKLYSDVPNLAPEGPSVFYITSNDPQSLFGVFTFGFWPRAGIIYKITKPENTPLTTENYQELLAYAKDGTPLKTVHGRTALPVPLERIYAFEFNSGELKNITQDTREKISKDLKKSISF